MGEDSGDKTEEPTPHKLREARKKGQIAKSQDMTSAILLLVSFYTFKNIATKMWSGMVGLETTVFRLISQDLSPALMGHALNIGYKTILTLLMPLFGVIFIVTIVVESLQTGFLLTGETLMPKFENLNPINGFKKFFSLKQYVELFKSIIKMSLVVWILYYIIREQYFIVSQSQARNLWVVMLLAGNIVIKVVTQVGILFIILSLLDYFYQRFEFIKSMKMTKKEIKEEYKRLEGDPTVKQRQREAQRSMAQGRQMGAVPGADVVVTNPIHVAVAIKFIPGEMEIPMIVAKGKRLIAQEIKAIADETYIPIIENPPLARSLFKLVEIGQAIPQEHYKIVAEILAFVFHLKKNRNR